MILNMNKGGWPAMEMRTYTNGDFFNKLPEDLQDIIIDTKVISGHGSRSGETNFTSTDKIYLLSGHEVWEDGTSNKVSTYDTAYNQTRQLDYYKSKGVTTSNNSGAIKYYRGSSGNWWLRTAISNDTSYFLLVGVTGHVNHSTDYYLLKEYGFAPAFRIG